MEIHAKGIAKEQRGKENEKYKQLFMPEKFWDNFINEIGLLLEIIKETKPVLIIDILENIRIRVPYLILKLPHGLRMNNRLSRQIRLFLEIVLTGREGT